jgi:hypothetical protein
VFAVQKIRFYGNTGIDRYIGNDNCSVVVLTLNLHGYDNYAKRSNRDNAITMGYCIGNATNRARCLTAVKFIKAGLRREVFSLGIDFEVFSLHRAL